MAPPSTQPTNTHPPPPSSPALLHSPRRRGSYRDDDYRDRRGGYSPRRRDSNPMTYREFTLTLHDDVSPEESKQLFEEYLADWYGSSIKAEFEARKGEAWYGVGACCVWG